MPVADVLAEEFLLLELLPLLSTVDGTLDFLARRGLLSNSCQCQQCLIPCTKVLRRGIDMYVWRCPRCHRKKSIRDGSFFSGSNLSLQKLVTFIYMWTEDLPLKFIKRQTTISHDETATNWGNMLRELCSQDLIANFRQLGGFDVNGAPIIVEIDESKYFHRKYHRGAFRGGHWVFGAVERETGRCLLEVVPNRNRRTLEAIISRWLLPGTRILSDGWRAYNRLNRLNGAVYMHHVVVHEDNFVDPWEHWLHTNTIEGKWMLAKRKLRRQFGTSRALFPSYLDEFMWRTNTGNNKFGEIIRCMRQFYPV